MLPEALIEKITLFYYFTFLDESKALAAAVRTVKALKDQPSINRSSSLEMQTAVIYEVEKSVKRQRDSIRPSSLTFSTGSVVTPDGLSWGPWFEFRKFADENEFRTVVYSRIMKFSDQAIADGMNLPIGTVRYRLGRGLRALGRILQPSRTNEDVRTREGRHD